VRVACYTHSLVLETRKGERMQSPAKKKFTECTKLCDGKRLGEDVRPVKSSFNFLNTDGSSTNLIFKMMPFDG